MVGIFQLNTILFFIFFDGRCRNDLHGTFWLFGVSWWEFTTLAYSILDSTLMWFGRSSPFQGIWVRWSYFLLKFKVVFEQRFVVPFPENASYIFGLFCFKVGLLVCVLVSFGGCSIVHFNITVILVWEDEEIALVELIVLGFRALFLNMTWLSSGLETFEAFFLDSLQHSVKWVGTESLAFLVYCRAEVGFLFSISLSLKSCFSWRWKF